MIMNTTQILISIALFTVGTMLTRFLAFVVFRENREAPKFVQYLGNALPAAMRLAETYRVEMPLAAAVNAVVNEGADPKDAVAQLMRRGQTTEVY